MGHQSTLQYDPANPPPAPFPFNGLDWLYKRFDSLLPPMLIFIGIGAIGAYALSA